MTPIMLRPIIIRPVRMAPIPSQSESAGLSPSLVMARTASSAMPAVFIGCTTERGARPTAMALRKVPENCSPCASSQGRQWMNDLTVCSTDCEPIRGELIQLPLLHITAVVY